MNKIQQKFVLDALGQPENLNDWEYDFINDLADKRDEYELTRKQNAKLNEISQKLD